METLPIIGFLFAAALVVWLLIRFTKREAMSSESLGVRLGRIFAVSAVVILLIAYKNDSGPSAPFSGMPMGFQAGVIVSYALMIGAAWAVGWLVGVTISRTAAYWSSRNPTHRP